MEKADIYFGEIEIQVRFAKASFKELENSIIESNISSIFMHIHHFLIHVSNIDKILDVNRNKFRKEILGNITLKVGLEPFRKVRNHLEHFDERLDRWIKTMMGTLSST